MKRSIIEGFVALALAGLTSCAERSSVIQPAPTTVGEKGEFASAPAAEFEGSIGRIEPDLNLITVHHWPLSKKFKVPPECQIDILTNASAVLAQLKPGDAVVVTYSGTGQDLVANRIVRKGKAQNQERDEKLERLDKMLNPSPNQ